MFPIRDHNPSEKTPYVTLILIGLNIVMFIATLGDGPGGMPDLWWRLALYPGAVTNGDMLIGLVSHMFLHAGFMHIAGNMLFLWIFGDNLEERMGHLGFLIFYLACGLLAAAAQIYANPSEMIPMVGASGAVAGVMGGYLLLYPRARVDVLVIIIILIRIFTIPAWVMLVLWFGVQLLGGFSSIAGEGGVAYWAHAGGFAAGVVLTIPVFARVGGAAYWRRNDGHPPHPEARYGRSRVPQVRR
ncbi:MAG: rhomboid family intramembrane serine protease [Paracoccus sp. (in: a-proteobacteria)]|nr:rhomboid family intramembrane serine protease [Paracoccus sp. (in: a-proteobacteria)]